MHSIGIYLNNKEYRVVFETEEEHKSYVVREYQFCRENLKKMWEAIARPDREKASEELNKARKIFAISNGYKLKGLRFIKSNDTIEKELA